MSNNHANTGANSRPIANLSSLASPVAISDNQGIDRSDTALATASQRVQALEKALEQSSRDNARLRRKLDFLMLGNSADQSLQNLTICNITFQNISLEFREQIEKLLYRISADREVIDVHHTWELTRRQNGAVEGRNRVNEWNPSFGLKRSVDLAKQAGYSGSVQYFHDFTLDTSAWPSPDRNRMDSHLWAVPYYEVAVDAILPVNWREREREEAQKRMGGGGGCFNCGSSAHGLSACPKPKDQDRIRRAISEWRRSRIEDGGDVRYHQIPGVGGSGSVVGGSSSGVGSSSSSYQSQNQNLMSPSLSLASSGFRSSTPSSSSSSITPQKPKAGVISERLRQALGIEPGQLPPWYRNIVYYGYPPSYYRVPPPPVKFTWIEPSNSNDSSQLNQPNQHNNGPQQPQQRIRTVSFPNLAAPLHDLSVFFDLYHPVEHIPSPSPSTTSSALQSSSIPSAKYQVTTLLDGIHPVPSRNTPSSSSSSSSAMAIDLTDDTPTPRNPKKRDRPDSPYKGSSSQNDLHNLRSSDDSTLFQGPIDKHSKIQESQDTSSIHHTSLESKEDATDWAQNLLDRLSESKILRLSEQDVPEEPEEMEPDLSIENLTANLPISTGIVRHQLSEQELSTHGAVQTSTGIWQKLKSILDERRQ